MDSPGQVLTTSATGQDFRLNIQKEELTFESALEQLLVVLGLTIHGCTESVRIAGIKTRRPTNVARVV